MDITTHNKILDVNSIRLAMGLEIECLKYNEHQMADILSNHEKYITNRWLLRNWI